jgi:hypothetical protein
VCTFILCAIYLRFIQSEPFPQFPFLRERFPCEKASILGSLIFHLMEYKSGKRSYAARRVRVLSRPLTAFATRSAFYDRLVF